MSRSTGFLGLALLALIAGASAHANVYEALKSNPIFSRTVAAIDKVGLTGAFLNPALKATIFVPTNAAWDIYLMATQQNFDALPASRLLPILQYHVFPNTCLKTDQLTNGQVLVSLSGRAATILKSGALITVDADSYSNSPVISPNDWVVCNSIIHAISWPIIPSDQVARLAPPPSPPAAVIPDRGSTAAPNSLPTALLGRPELSIATNLLRQHVALWNSTLVQNGQQIGLVFLPTNDAFTKFFATKSYNAATIGTARASALLLNHIVLGYSAPSSQWKNGDKLYTQLDGKFLTVNIGLAGLVTVTPSNQPSSAAAKIINANNVAGNILFHICDAVLVPTGAGI